MHSHPEIAAALVAAVTLLASATGFPFATETGFPPGGASAETSGVYGVDDRRPLDDLAQWAMIGRVERRVLGRSGGDGSRHGPAVCTGTLVGPSLVLTNAHCVLDDAGVFSPRAVVFRSGLTGYVARGASGVATAALGTRDPSADRRNDWALLVLSSPLGDQLGYLEVEGAPPSARVALVGYALDFGQGRTPFVDSSCRLKGRRVSRGYVRHDCDIAVGASGAPLLIASGRHARIVAINAAKMATQPFAPAFLATERTNIAVDAARFLPALRHMQRCASKVASRSPAATPFDPETTAGLCMM